MFKFINLTRSPSSSSSKISSSNLILRNYANNYQYKKRPGNYVSLMTQNNNKL